MHQEIIQLTAGEFVVSLVARLESGGIPVVYLRNYLDLPRSVGNDSDLLIQGGKLDTACTILADFSKLTNWSLLNKVRFGPLSVFLFDSLSGEFLHIDFFERLDWHFVPLADSGLILGRRIWNGVVHHAHPEDEIYLNLITRLIYQATIREKHRIQASNYTASHEGHTMDDTIRLHLGCSASPLLSGMIGTGDWDKLEKQAPKFRSILLKQAITRKFGSTSKGLLEYLLRGVRRAWAPTGPFIVFEGADGVGKSSLINALVPVFYGLTGRKDTLLFHWKPTRQSTQLPDQPAADSQDPRGKQSRPLPVSLLYLAYHWLGFWLGYFWHVYPARLKNRAVIGDRYAYEFFLDPRRLRLRAPDWFLRFAANSVPQPQQVIALHADPDVIIRRKPELTHAEIESYQAALRKMSDHDPRVSLINADGEPGCIASAVSSTIVSRIQRSGESTTSR